MKTKHIKIALSILIALSLGACSNDFNTVVEKTADFDYKTTKEYNVSVVALNNENLPYGGVQIKLYTQNPLNEDGTLKADNESFLIYKGNTNNNGILTCEIAPATSVDSLSILVNQIGLPALSMVKLSDRTVNVQIGGNTRIAAKSSKIGQEKVAELPIPKISNGYYILGSWDNKGVPSYLNLPNDIITPSLLADINASLPEYKKLTDSHPQYLEDLNDGSIKLYEDAEVWVTFVHEGAGWLNTLAYYTYPNDNPPATAAAISDKTIIFPNLSFLSWDNTGGLVSGNKVQLLYLDPITKLYSTKFPKNTSVAWVLRAKGWSNSTQLVVNDYRTHYSDVRFNSEIDPKKKKHNVVLNDAARKLLLVGFEDMDRENGSDNDFNDAIFYATVTPFTAINQTQYEEVDKPVDTDEDGVTDANDEYPKDPKKAYNNYYPSKGQTGTLAFEDLWPSKGDYDFNDVVVDYNYNQITNADNKIVALDAIYTLRASGANNHDAFGIQFNTTADNVVSVTGQHLTNGFIKNETNGAESGQSKAVIIAFDDAKALLKMYNTTSGSYSTPFTDTLKITFATPINPTDFGSAPYNPFIIINKPGEYERGREVHLSGSSPTTLANLSLFGIQDDSSNPSTGKYYTSSIYLPWAINIPTKFDYPSEKQDITKAYLKFNSWATSRGTSYQDWYSNKTSGFRDNSKIFVK